MTTDNVLVGASSITLVYPGTCQIVTLFHMAFSIAGEAWEVAELRGTLTGEPPEPLARKFLASSTIVLKWSSSNQHSLVVRHSSCTRDVTTKLSSCVPRLDKTSANVRLAARNLEDICVLGGRQQHQEQMYPSQCTCGLLPVQVRHKVVAHLQLYRNAAAMKEAYQLVALKNVISVQQM